MMVVRKSAEYLLCSVTSPMLLRVNQSQSHPNLVFDYHNHDYDQHFCDPFSEYEAYKITPNHKVDLCSLVLEGR